VSRIKKILVPVDFSEASDQAARYAIDLAQQLSGPDASVAIELVHAWQLAGYATPTSDLAKETERALHDQIDGYAKATIPGGIAVRTHLRLGVPYDEIVSLATEIQADLIVMGTTGKTGLEHFLVGSVAERVIRSATMPVITVRQKKKD
jgi:nucleotide-binding universal stress UspA family protein